MADITIDVNPQQQTIDAIPQTQDNPIHINMYDINPSLVAKFAMPSNVYKDLILGASGETYTASANGYFSLNKRTGNSGFVWASIEIYDPQDNLIYTMEESRYGDASANLSFFIPVQKNYRAKISYNAIGTTEAFRFVYAEGSKQEANDL